MKYVLLTEKEFELYEKMVNEGKIGKFLTTGAIALGLFGGGQQANAMNYDYMKKNPNSAIQLSENKWIFAIYMILTARKGMSSLQMSKELSITQKSTWFMQHRIRTAMSHGKYADMLKGIVEVDETYIGGKEDNKHASKKLNAGRGAIGKTPVFGIKQRNGKVVSMVVPDTTKERLQTIIGSMVVPGTTVNTDDSKSYNGLNIKGYTHNVVNHSAKQYVDGMAYTNSIESVWSVLKRGFYGTFHKFSIKHLQRYVDEFDFRLNDGNVKIPTDERINSVICGCWGKIMPYKTLKII